MVVKNPGRRWARTAVVGSGAEGEGGGEGGEGKEEEKKREKKEVFSFFRKNTSSNVGLSRTFFCLFLMSSFSRPRLITI